MENFSIRFIKENLRLIFYYSIDYIIKKDKVKLNIYIMFSV